MTVREKFLSAIKRQSDDYVPFEFSLCPKLENEFYNRTGSRDYAAYYGFAFRNIYAEDMTDKNKFKKYFEKDSKIIIGEWGVGRKKGSVAHFTEMKHPMKEFISIEQFIEYPFPDPVLDYNWGKVVNEVEQIKANDLIAVASMAWTIFELAWYLRGMDNLFLDMAFDNEIFEYLLNRITKIRCEMAAEYARSGADILHLGDDVSTQLSMMMNPDSWREYFKPRLKKVIDEAKNVRSDIIIFYHGDGNLQEIIPDLIEVGVDILNPVQPECMDPVKIKQTYGSRLSFWGTLGTQTTMPFGSAKDVKECCEKMIKEVGRGGGLVLAPTHLLEPEVPWQNIETFINTVAEYNTRHVSRISFRL